MCVCVWFSLVWFTCYSTQMLSAAEAKSSYRFSPNTHARTKSELRKSTWILLTSNIIRYRSKVFFYLRTVVVWLINYYQGNGGLCMRISIAGWRIGHHFIRGGVYFSYPSNWADSQLIDSLLLFLFANTSMSVFSILDRYSVSLHLRIY